MLIALDLEYMGDVEEAWRHRYEALRQIGKVRQQHGQRRLTKALDAACFGLQKEPQQAGASNSSDQAAKDSPDFQPQRKQAPWHLDFSLFGVDMRTRPRDGFCAATRV